MLPGADTHEAAVVAVECMVAALSHHTDVSDYHTDVSHHHSYNLQSKNIPFHKTADDNKHNNISDVVFPPVYLSAQNIQWA